jgi:hypothetical protein
MQLPAGKIRRLQRFRSVPNFGRAALLFSAERFGCIQRDAQEKDLPPEPGEKPPLNQKEQRPTNQQCDLLAPRLE